MVIQIFLMAAAVVMLAVALVSAGVMAQRLDGDDEPGAKAALLMVVITAAMSLGLAFSAGSL